MPSDFSSDVKFEIGHVLFIDIVGYSKLLINEQSEQIQQLKEIVRGTEQFPKQVGRAGGEHVIVPDGLPMHLTATGTVQRRALVVILHDASKPPTAFVHDSMPKGLCKN